ncbi:MAG: S-adenosylmethionine:tRNA ribosyltransferase-isomerase [Bacteroidales bacterium]|nr:S-adenosylmethionine:tRNA ribosyltransferase-isomerase [Bacteroidales bacterium]
MLSIKDFDYTLPENRIAQYPLPDRDKSKLLIFNRGKIDEDIFANISAYLPEGSCLISNNTKVINARLIFKKNSGASIEIFCLEPSEPADYTLAFQKKHESEWLCMVGNLKKWKGERLNLTFESNQGNITIYAQLLENFGNFQKIRFSWLPADLPFGTILEAAGRIPLPPYIKRETEEIDKIRYQTIFSKLEGSVAAPTAGLHFSEKVLDDLSQKNIQNLSITLHVGAGTFRPVKHEDALKHDMHSEHFFVSLDLLKQLKKYLGNITAVGTTSLRAIESAYWLGVKMMQSVSSKSHRVEQWEYKTLPQPQPHEVVEFLENYCIENNLTGIHAETQLMIVPGYPFKMVSRLITNFHQPQSTLLLLVAAFVGVNRWREIYNYALENDFRFLSYGDSSLLIP